ncbi:MAG: tetratricopeptide repeat protein [Methanotrichaceae archaeon]
MKFEPILVLMLMLIPPGFASSGNASINNTTTAENHIAINESDPVYWYNKGEVLLNSGRYNESIDAYNKAIELNQSFEAAWRQKCNAFFKLSQYNKTVECNKRAMELERSDAKAWYNKGFSLQAEYDAARKAFDKDTDLSTSVCPCQMH